MGRGEKYLTFPYPLKVQASGLGAVRDLIYALSLTGG